MSNSLKVIDLVLKESQRIAHEKLSFIATTDLQYDKSFTYQAGKGPNGQTLRVREPNQFTRTQGSRLADVQDVTETTQDITVATQDHVAMRFNSAELMQSVNSTSAFDDLSKSYIEPAIASFVSGIEADYIAYCTKRTYNVVGTAGTPPTDLVAIGAARARLNQGLAPKDGKRYIQADSVTMAGMVNGLKGLFQDSSQIKEQYREGMMGRTGGFDWYENDRMYTQTNTSDVAVTTAAAAAVTNGGTNITLASVATATTAGMTFTVAGVYACHPETKQSLGYLQQYVVITGGTTTQEVRPATWVSGAKQNVCDATGAAIAVTAYNGTAVAVTFQGAASTSYLQNLAYHKEAFQFITADLPLMDDAHKCVRSVKDGLSMRVWQASDIRNDELILRVDMLYGMAALRPAWACRITN